MSERTEATIDTKEIKAWAAAQEWAFEHDLEGGWDAYCVIKRLCDEIERLRAELNASLREGT